VSPVLVLFQPVRAMRAVQAVIFQLAARRQLDLGKASFTSTAPVKQLLLP